MTKSERVPHASSVLRSAALLDPFSANGAYQPSLGQRPREVEPSRVQALKARFIQRWYLGQAESRFQRWVLLYPRSWGVAPGCHETAPLALKRGLPADRTKRQHDAVGDGCLTRNCNGRY
jgi:hypothetical protein